MMLMLVPIALPLQNSQVAPDFDSHDLRNAMMPLMILSVSCDADIGDTGITWAKMLWLHLILIFMTLAMQWCTSHYLTLAPIVLQD